VELRQLRTFMAVSRHGSVTDAAIDLALAPSTVSEQIRTLERSLGVALFTRTARGMRLTAAGERMLSWAQRLLDQADQARADVTAAGRQLRLGALETIAATHVPVVLARLAERRPDISVLVRSQTGRDRLFSALAAGDLDAALVLDSGLAVGGLGFEPPAAPLDFVDLDKVPLVLVADAGHRLAGKPALTPDDLAGERLLVNVPSCSFWLAASTLLDPGMERVEAGSVAVMRAWAERGLGVSLLPRFAVSDALADGRLIALDLAAPDLSLRLVWRADREDQPALREVLYAAVRAA
jgi:DNA-binding transcriptional LysR family regulator